MPSGVPEALQAAEKSLLHLILGGAAVHRCDNRLLFSTGFSRLGQNADRERVFQQSV
jgi:hypothetical protein